MGWYGILPDTSLAAWNAYRRFFHVMVTKEHIYNNNNVY